MAKKGEMSTEKWVFRGKMGVFGLEINRTSNQTRKVKWCKMQVLFLKTDKIKDVKGKKWWLFTYFTTCILARTE